MGKPTQKMLGPFCYIAIDGDEFNGVIDPNIDTAARSSRSIADPNTMPRWIGSTRREKSRTLKIRSNMTLAALQLPFYSLPDKFRALVRPDQVVDIFGFINREHIEKKFGMSTPQASVDIQHFIDANPGILTYNRSAKRYEAA